MTIVTSRPLRRKRPKPAQPAGGLSDAVIIVGLEEAVEALDEGLAEGSDGGAG
jgi:hypothetical protein